MFPNNRKESEAILATSPINSIIPTKNEIGATISTLGPFSLFFTIDPSSSNLTYLFNVFHRPSVTIPKTLEPITEIKPSVSVVFMSAVPPLKNGTKTL